MTALLTPLNIKDPYQLADWLIWRFCDYGVHRRIVESVLWEHGPDRCFEMLRTCDRRARRDGNNVAASNFAIAFMKDPIEYFKRNRAWGYREGIRNLPFRIPAGETLQTYVPPWIANWHPGWPW